MFIVSSNSGNNSNPLSVEPITPTNSITGSKSVGSENSAPLFSRFALFKNKTIQTQKNTLTSTNNDSPTNNNNNNKYTSHTIKAKWFGE
jgi:hypothetical protein